MNQPQDSEVAALIARLENHDPGERERVAAEIFARGRERAQESTIEWFHDDALVGCFLMDHSGFPRATVGVAVFPEKFERIRAVNGMPRLADVPADLDAQEFELHFAEPVRLDILTTRNAADDGAMARFLRKSGEGIQQVELDVRQLDSATNILRDRFGLTPIYADGRAGADATRVNFFLIAANNSKLLIELVESAPRT